MRRWEAWTNHLGWALVSASGILYGVLKYFVGSPDPDSRLGHPWQPSVLAAHILLAPAAIFGLGLVFRRHALARWRMGEREGRKTGTILLFAAFALILSGYLLQAFTGESARRWTGWLHAAIGLLVAAAYALHPRGSWEMDDARETPAEEPSVQGPSGSS